jgi:hypothetical protein
MKSICQLVPIEIRSHAVTHVGDVRRTVFFRPKKCRRGNATKLPKKAPNGGIELTQDAIFLSGSKSGLSSFIEGIAGAE